MFRFGFNRFPSTSRRLLQSSFSSKVPKKLYGIHGRYAEATYLAASNAKLLDKVDEELKAFMDVVSKVPDFSAFLNNPTIPRNEKIAKVNAVFGDGKVSHITRNLLLTLCANGRIGESAKVVDAYDVLMQAGRGVVTAVVISSEPLKKKSIDTVRAAILKMTGSNAQVDIKYEVNEKIIGGLQVIVDDKFLDLSVASRIAELSKILESS